MHESEKWKWSRSVMSNSVWPHGLQPTRLFCPWDFPGKSTGVGCHCLLLPITCKCVLFPKTKDIIWSHFVLCALFLLEHPSAPSLAHVFHPSAKTWKIHSLLLSAGKISIFFLVTVKPCQKCYVQTPFAFYGLGACRLHAAKSWIRESSLDRACY